MAHADIRRTPGRQVDPRASAAPAADRRDAAPDRLWLRVGLFTAGLLASLAGLHVLLRETDWWFISAVFVILTLAAVTAARRLLVRDWLAPLAGIVVAILALTLVFAADTAIVGVIPTVDTLDRFVQLSLLGDQAIRTQGIPATAPTGLVFLIVVLALGCALAGETLVARTPALAGLPYLVVLGVPVLLRPDIADPGVFVIVVLLYLGLLRVGRRYATGSAVVLSGAAVLLGALVAPLALPPVDAVWRPLTGLGPGSGLNPLIDLGADLRRADPVTAVRYVTNSGSGLYLRLATLDDFNGQTWRPATAGTDDDTSVQRPFPAPAGLEDDVAQRPLAVTVEVGEVSGSWLPVPYPAIAIDGLDGDWFWEPEGLAVRTVRSDARGQRFDAEFLQIAPTPAQLAESVPDPGGDSRYLDLPDLPDIVAQTALDVAGSSSTSYEAALALQSFFTGGDFRYSEDAPVTEGYDGTGLAVLAEFLEQREGYCIHFASAMAVMARSLGIPARIAVGFQPGDPSLVDGVTVYTVSSHDLHAWPELFFEGIGWLRFEPTPGRGSVPDYTPTATVGNPANPGLEVPTPSTVPSGVPTALPGAEDALLPGADSGAAAADATAWPVVIPLLALGVVAILLIPAMVRVTIRTRRLRAMRAGRGAAAAAWAEVRDTARDHGWAAPQTETARDLGDRLEVVLTHDRETIHRLRDRVESIAYAVPLESVMTTGDLGAVRSAIVRSASARDRLRAVLLPPSLLARLGFGSDSDYSS